MKTREQWLQDALEMMKTELFTKEVIGERVYPEVYVSTGTCNGLRGAKLKTLGVCYDPSVSSDKKAHIMIDFQMNDSSRVLDVLAHEMVHAVVGNQAGHGKEFRDVAVGIGLEGKMTATTASEALKEKLASIIDILGAYPHPIVKLGAKKKQSTRMIKMICVNTDYVARTSNKWLDQFGPTICPCCNEEMQLG